jgi:hypothetical protein
VHPPIDRSEITVPENSINVQSALSDKIAWARKIHSLLRERIISDKDLKKLIVELEGRINSSYRCMQEIGVVKECSECADASCCGKGIENRYDPVTLLINLLLGVELPEERVTDGCFFLTPVGCSLRAREVICVNYLCSKILDNIDHQKIIKLQVVFGYELDALFQLSEKLKKIISEISKFRADGSRANADLLKKGEDIVEQSDYIREQSDYATRLLNLLEPEEREFMSRVHEEIVVSKINRKVDLPVVYAGSGGDLEHAILLGNNLVFFDSHLPEETLSEILTKVERIGTLITQKRSGELRKGGKHIIRFRVQDSEFKLTFYAEDATKIGDKFFPEELREGIAVYFVKVPLPKERKVGSLTSVYSLAKMLGNIVLGGYFLERECPISAFLKPEILGFERVASGYISALSVNRDAEGNLYRKIRDVEELSVLLEIDSELERIYRMKEESDRNFNKINSLLERLPEDVRREVEQIIGKYLGKY